MALQNFLVQCNRYFLSVIIRGFANDHDGNCQAPPQQANGTTDASHGRKRSISNCRSVRRLISFVIIPPFASIKLFAGTKLGHSPSLILWINGDNFSPNCHFVLKVSIPTEAPEVAGPPTAGYVAIPSPRAGHCRARGAYIYTCSWQHLEVGRLAI